MSVVNRDFSARTGLTLREWRVAALVAGDVPVEKACEILKITAGTLESHKQAIRRKLGVPHRQRLRQYLREHLEDMPTPPAEVRVEPSRARGRTERRESWLLRSTLTELSAMAGWVEQRVTTRQTTTPEEAAEEELMLRRVARELAEIYGRLISEARADEIRQSPAEAMPLRTVPTSEAGPA